MITLVQTDLEGNSPGGIPSVHRFCFPTLNNQNPGPNLPQHRRGQEVTPNLSFAFFNPLNFFSSNELINHHDILPKIFSFKNESVMH